MGLSIPSGRQDIGKRGYSRPGQSHQDGERTKEFCRESHSDQRREAEGQAGTTPGQQGAFRLESGIEEVMLGHPIMIVHM